MPANNTVKIGFLLLHGAGLDTWVWEKVIPRLNYPALSVDYPGRGKRAGQRVDRLPLSSYTGAALHDLDGFNPPRVVVVAHSIGGIVGLEVAALRRNRIGGFIAIGAAIPARDGSYTSSLPWTAGLFLRLMLAGAGTRPPSAALRRGLCNDLDETHAALVTERFFPEAKQLYTGRRSSHDLPGWAAYIRLSRDQAIGPDWQDRMISRLKPRRVEEIDSGHLPMLGRPEELARALNDYASSLSA